VVKTVNKSGGLVDAIYEWLQYKKYGITYNNDEERLGIAIAISKSMSKDGSYKRKNKDKRTTIIKDSIGKAKPTLFKALITDSAIRLRSEVGKIIKSINSEKV
jgi:hypothetical protein